MRYLEIFQAIIDNLTLTQEARWVITPGKEKEFSKAVDAACSTMLQDPSKAIVTSMSFEEAALAAGFPKELIDECTILTVPFRPKKLQ